MNKQIDRFYEIIDNEEYDNPKYTYCRRKVNESYNQVYS